MMETTERAAVLMYDITTGDHLLYDIYIGADAHLAALDLAMSEATSTLRPIVLDVNALIAESGVTAAELVAILESAP